MPHFVKVFVAQPGRTTTPSFQAAVRWNRCVRLRMTRLSRSSTPCVRPRRAIRRRKYFASISLPLGISIAVGRGRAVSAGQRNWGRCCTLQPHYSFATGVSLHSAELGVACVLKQGVGGLPAAAPRKARVAASRSGSRAAAAPPQRSHSPRVAASPQRSPRAAAAAAALS